MRPVKILTFLSFLFLLASCGAHNKRGISISFPENGSVYAIDQLDAKTANLTFQRHDGRQSELIVRDIGRGPLFRALVPDTNIADPDLSAGFIIVDAKAQRIHVFLCEVSAVEDFIVGNDSRLDEVTRVERISEKYTQDGVDTTGVAYITGARILNITGTYKIRDPNIVPKWMISHPLRIDSTSSLPDSKWYEKYLAK